MTTTLKTQKLSILLISVLKSYKKRELYIIK